MKNRSYSTRKVWIVIEDNEFPGLGIIYCFKIVAGREEFEQLIEALGNFAALMSLHDQENPSLYLSAAMPAEIKDKRVIREISFEKAEKGIFLLGRKYINFGNLPPDITILELEPVSESPNLLKEVLADRKRRQNNIRI